MKPKSSQIMDLTFSNTQPRPKAYDNVILSMIAATNEFYSSYSHQTGEYQNTHMSVFQVNLLSYLCETEVHGFELYTLLKSHFQKLITKLKLNCKQMRHQELLLFYSLQWKKYQVFSKELHRVTDSFNQHWVKRQRDENKLNFLYVYQLALVAWRDCFLSSFITNLICAVIKLIQKQQNGDDVNPDVVTSVLQFYEELSTHSLLDQATSGNIPSKQPALLRKYCMALQNKSTEPPNSDEFTEILFELDVEIENY